MLEALSPLSKSTVTRTEVWSRGIKKARRGGLLIETLKRLLMLGAIVFDRRGNRILGQDRTVNLDRG